MNSAIKVGADYLRFADEIQITIRQHFLHRTILCGYEAVNTCTININHLGLKRMIECIQMVFYYEIRMHNFYMHDIHSDSNQTVPLSAVGLLRWMWRRWPWDGVVQLSFLYEVSFE